MAAENKVQVLKDGEPELTSTISTFVRSYKVLVPGYTEEIYANITYEQRNYEALAESLSGMLYCTDIDLDEVPEEFVADVESLIRKSLALDGIEVSEDLVLNP